ncbi:MAG: TMEM198/TM7SF3 family protein [Verrucomicrobiales bacterium]|nr:TMEM198/TM7SF3 family protein [Verrucomicrobiales bacterium]
MTALTLIVALILLCFGRRLFWFFVGAAGFVAGLVIGQELLPGQPEWIGLLVAIVAGLVGALLALFLQKLAIALAGFLFGAYLLMNLAAGVGNEAMAWPAFLIGGIVGAILVLVVFDWALILLSSLAGATLLVDSLGLARDAQAVLLVALVISGVLMQSLQRRRDSLRGKSVAKASPPSV